ncbi:MAG: hypothetical protein GC168_19430 [Candidatus Hydrogenedens sp.]|nr:hypothetical protein [Candidatus Hydrogenedens sp.]
MIKRLVPAALALAVFAGAAAADYLEVRRPAAVKYGPESGAERIYGPEVGTNLQLLDEGQQENGYYKVSVPADAGSAVPVGWVYRTLVRRFPGDMPPVPGGDAPESLDPDVAALIESVTITWPARHDESPEPHTVFGVPRCNPADPAHQLLLDYSGFSVYWDDVVLGPRWTAIKLTSFMANAGGEIGRESKFSTDPRIAEAGLRATRHEDYNNETGSKKWARGHMVQFDDARGWGEESGRESFYTSNIAPQLQAHNGKRWLALEKACTEFARDYGLVWVYTGPIYPAHPEPFIPGRDVPVPVAFYKIVVSPGDSGAVDVLAFRMPHQDIPTSVALADFLVSVDQIEEETDIDFLYELPDAVEGPVESVVWGMWPDLEY